MAAARCTDAVSDEERLTDELAAACPPATPVLAFYEGPDRIDAGPNDREGPAPLGGLSAELVRAQWASGRGERFDAQFW